MGAVAPNVGSWAWHLRVNVLAASRGLGPWARGRILRSAGLEVSPQSVVQPGCFFFGADATIGRHTWVGHRVYLDTRAHVEIGERCNLGMEVMVCTSGHRMGPAQRRAGEFIADPVHIADGTWIGTRAVILGGVTVGSGCMVAAGAVVTESCGPNGLYAGAPARRIRDLPQ